jgi:hypothetical protein
VSSQDRGLGDGRSVIRDSLSSKSLLELCIVREVVAFLLIGSAVEELLKRVLLQNSVDAGRVGIGATSRVSLWEEQ